MKKIIMIMLILLTCSSMVMADDEETVEIPSYSETNVVGNKTTTLTEDVGNYFIWSIPENLQMQIATQIGRCGQVNRSELATISGRC